MQKHLLFLFVSVRRLGARPLTPPDRVAKQLGWGCDCEALPIGRWSEQVSSCRNTADAERTTAREGYADVAKGQLIKTVETERLARQAETYRVASLRP